MESDTRRETPGFFGAVLGLVFEPGSTTEALLSEEAPPFTISLILTLFIAIFAPIVLYSRNNDVQIQDPYGLVSIVLVVALAFFIFLILECIFLRVLGVDVSFFTMFSCACYCLTPLIIGALLIYGFNYLASGDFTVIRLIVTGYRSSQDPFMRFVPLALMIIQFNIFLVFFYSVRFFGDMHNITAFILSLFSALPAYFSFVISLASVELIRPKTTQSFVKVINAFPSEMPWW